MHEGETPSPAPWKGKKTLNPGKLKLVMGDKEGFTMLEIPNRINRGGCDWTS